MATLDEALAASAEISNATVKVEKAMIIPGTTPTLLVKIPNVILSATTKARMDIKQSNKLLMQTACTIDGSSVSYHFAQEETYLFKEGEIRVQIHGLMSDKNAWKTKVFTINIGESLSSITIE